MKRQGNIPAMLVHSRMGLIAACSSFGMACLGMVHTQCSRSCGARLRMCNHFDAALWGEGWWHIGLQTTTPDSPTIHHFSGQPATSCCTMWLVAGKQGVASYSGAVCSWAISPPHFRGETRCWSYHPSLALVHHGNGPLQALKPSLSARPLLFMALEITPPSNGTSHPL